MRRFLLTLFLFLSIQAPVLADNEYLNLLIDKADQLQLDQRHEWRALMHYKPHLLKGVTSQVDGKNFFNSPDGKTNPREELIATLRSFFAEAVVETKQVQHPQCLFVARYHWLKHELNFDPARLPEQPCQRFDQWMTGMDPAGITLVFPAAYLNNPASMFGHTFLRIDGKNQDERTRLLAYSVSYAAGTEESNGLVFALKGVFGGYPGLFSIMPYYMKVKEYSDLENRDVWEYQLNLTEDEIRQLLRHVWELGQTYFDYYFFDENCAYHLLSLLEVARPSLKLTDQFPVWAIPPETVRAVVAETGLATNITYRPAMSTQLAHRLSEIDQPHKQLILALAENRIAPDDTQITDLPISEQGLVLDLAYDYLEYNRVAQDKSPDDLSDHSLKLLHARSKLNTASTRTALPLPSVRPDQGHRTTRFGVGIGKQDDTAFVELGWRPAYHDMFDPADGYVDGAQLKFMSFVARHYDDHRRWQLHDFTLMQIFSATPRDDFFKPISWSLQLAAQRLNTSQNSDLLMATAKGGPGVSYKLGKKSKAYALFQGAFGSSGEFRDNYALGAGLNLGLLVDLPHRIKMGINGEALRYGLGERFTDAKVNMEVSYHYDLRNSLRFNLSQQQAFHYHRTEGYVSLYHYF